MTITIILVVQSDSGYQNFSYPNPEVKSADNLEYNFKNIDLIIVKFSQ